ncbi:hypothetical protein AVEN_31352-2-1, partial [Araneus ventricosus]
AVRHYGSDESWIGRDESRIGKENRQERIEKGQEEMKNQIQAHVKSQVEGMKDHVNSCIKKIEDVQAMKGEIEDVKGEVQRKTDEVKGEVHRKIEEVEGKV